MGGEQAAGVLAQIRRRGRELPPADEAALVAEIRARYDEETSPYFSTARLWDDGVLDPRDTRAVLGLALETTLNAPISDSPIGVLRV
jgi:acetyl-CoA carboxylase carboxyltransferase component